ncbi:hypothetical protein QW180_22220 [Vibrio sinaloensis]|nr:hypothetical protein [Vibrio sinaloensis]
MRKLIGGVRPPVPPAFKMTASIGALSVATVCWTDAEFETSTMTISKKCLALWHRPVVFSPAEPSAGYDNPNRLFFDIGLLSELASGFKAKTGIRSCDEYGGNFAHGGSLFFLL